MFCVLLNLRQFEQLLVNKDVPRFKPTTVFALKLSADCLREGA